MTSPRSAPGSAERRRRRIVLAVGACVVVVVISAFAAGVGRFGGDDDAAPSATPTTSTAARRGTTTPAPTTIATGATTATTTAAGTTAPAGPPPEAGATAIGRSYAVGTRSLTFVDSSRTTSPNGAFGGAPTRTLPTKFWYPAEGPSGGVAAADAPPDAAQGPYPLVLFAHGYDVTPDFYAPLLERWAAAGYVVAAPVFPILSGSDGGASHVDYEKTFEDARFVISQVLALGAGEPLGGLVDPARIAAAGHSDGEVISFGVGFLACCRDQRVKAVISMAGDLANANNPSVRDTGTPILHIMELHDEYDPYPHSIQWDRDNLTAPRWMVSLDSSHVPPYTRPGDPAFELVGRITIAYLDGTLKGHPERLGDVTAAVDAQPSVASIER